MTELAHFVWTPTVARATAGEKHSQTGPTDLQVVNVECFRALNSVRRVELPKRALTPDQQIAFSTQCRGERPSSDLDHSAK